jgi:hypothetical protein
MHTLFRMLTPAIRVGMIFFATLALAGCGEARGGAQPTPTGATPSQATPTADTLPSPSAPDPVSTPDGEVGGPRPVPSVNIAPGAEPTSGVITGPTVGTSIPGGPVEGPPLSQISTPTPHTLLTPGPDGVVLVKTADRPTAIQMSVGDTIEFEREEFYDWDIQVNGSNLLAPQPTGGYRATGPGTTRVELQGDPKCLKSDPPCGAPSIGFSIEVTIR